jgi:hypothetical protein
MSGNQFGDRLVEPFLVLDIGHASRHPADAVGGSVAARVGSDAERFAVAGVEVDLDRPAKFGDREVEADVAVAWEFDAMLTNETSHSGPTQGLSDPNLGMGLGRTARQTSIERLEERSNPRSSG